MTFRLFPFRSPKFNPQKRNAQTNLSGTLAVFIPCLPGTRGLMGNSSFGCNLASASLKFGLLELRLGLWLNGCFASMCQFLMGRNSLDAPASLLLPRSLGLAFRLLSRSKWTRGGLKRFSLPRQMVLIRQRLARILRRRSQMNRSSVSQRPRPGAAPGRSRCSVRTVDTTGRSVHAKEFHS